MSVPCHLPILFSLLLYLGFCLCSGPCYRDDDCPKLHMQCRINGSAGGVCECSDGWISWKWECHPAAALGDPCVTSTQCQAKNEKSMCNPINSRCSCERGHTPTRATPTVSLGEEHEEVPNLICIQDKVYTTETFDAVPIFIEDKKLARPRHPPTHDAIHKAVTQAVSNNRRVFFGDTVVLLGLILLGLGVAGIATALYFKTVQEKRMSQAAVRSLLNLIQENEGMKRNYTSESLKTQNTDIESAEEKERKEKNIQENLENNRFEDSFNPAIEFGSLPSLPSKITLQPLEGEGIIKFPSPHMSHATLPPIKGKKKNKDDNEEKINPTKPNNFESLQLSPKARSPVEYRDPKSLPCNGFESNFVEVGPKKVEGEEDLSKLPMQTLSFKNLANVTYQRNTPEYSKSAASFPDENKFFEEAPPSYADLLK